MKYFIESLLRIKSTTIYIHSDETLCYEASESSIKVLLNQKLLEEIDLIYPIESIIITKSSQGYTTISLRNHFNQINRSINQKVNSKLIRCLNIPTAKHLQSIESIACLKCNSEIAVKYFDTPRPGHESIVIVLKEADDSLCDDIDGLQLFPCKSNLSKTNVLKKTNSIHEFSSPNQSSLFNRIVDLPSEHWHELIDCWRCHQEDYSQIKHFHGIIESKVNTLHVSHGFVGLHVKNIRDGSLLFQDSIPSSSKVCHHSFYFLFFL